MHHCNFYCYEDVHAFNVISAFDITTCLPEEVAAFKAEILRIHNASSRYTATTVENIFIAKEVESPEAWYRQLPGWTDAFHPATHRHCYVFLLRIPGITHQVLAQMCEEA